MNKKIPTPCFISHASHEKHKNGYKNGLLREPEYEASEAKAAFSRMIREINVENCYSCQPEIVGG